MSDAAAEIKSRLRLSEIVGRKVKLIRRGRDLVGLCPFHTEKTPSFHVHDDKGYYKCFGCGAGGDALTFVQETEGLDFREALEQLAALAGVELERRTPEARAAEERKKTLHDALEAACLVFEAELKGARGGAARAYLERRGLSAATIKTFRLGFAPGGGASLLETLKGKGYPLELLAEAGLVAAADPSRPARDFFFNRVMFPILDLRGRVIGFGARTLDPNGQPKYLNSPKTPVFDKSATLYNHAAARTAARAAQTAIVAEGYMDVIALAQAGFAHAVAPLGTALTDTHLTMLWKMAAEPVLCFDGDKAGVAAAYRAMDKALPLLAPGHSLRFALLPQGQDPDELLRAQGPGSLQAVLDGAKPLADMLWQRESAAQDLSTPERRAGFEKRVKALVATIADPEIRRFYADEFRARLNAMFRPAYARTGPAAPARPALRRNGPGRGRFPAEAGPAPPPSLRLRLTAAARRDGSPSEWREELLLLTLVNHPRLLAEHLDDAAQLEPTAANLDKLRRALIDHAAQGGVLDRPAMLTHLAACGLSDVVTQLAARPLSRAYVFALPDADAAAAERGFCELYAVHRAAAAQDWAHAVAHYAAEGSDDAYDRQRALDPDAAPDS